MVGRLARERGRPFGVGVQTSAGARRHGTGALEGDGREREAERLGDARGKASEETRSRRIGRLGGMAA